MSRCSSPLQAAGADAPAQPVQACQQCVCVLLCIPHQPTQHYTAHLMLLRAPTPPPPVESMQAQIHKLLTASSLSCLMRRRFSSTRVCVSCSFSAAASTSCCSACSLACSAPTPVRCCCSSDSASSTCVYAQMRSLACTYDKCCSTLLHTQLGVTGVCTFRLASSMSCSVAAASVSVM